MVALLEDRSLTRHPAATPARPPAHRPRLRVLDGGRTNAGDRTVAGLLALALALVVVVGGLRLVQGSPPATSWAELHERSLTSPVPAQVADGDLVIVVQPGDSLWSLAESLAPGQDPRPVVDVLARANGGTTLRAGQSLVVPRSVIGP
jgi:hypothetical protein